jgi:hypothetical protein
MIAQEKRIRMMFFRPKPGIFTNAHKCPQISLKLGAFPEFLHLKHRVMLGRSILSG